MTISLAIAVIVIADIALIAGLAYVMSRAAGLRRHVSAASARAPELARVVNRRPERHSQRPSRVPASVGS